MAFCQNCGAELPDGAKFCPDCGAPAEEVSRDAQPGDSAFIPESVPVAPAVSNTRRAPEGGNGKTARLIGAVVIAAVVVLALVMLFFGGRGSDSAAFPAPSADGVSVLPVGYYAVQSLSINGKDYDLAQLGDIGYGGWFLSFNGDGSGSALAFTEDEQSFTYTGDKLSFADGLVTEYSCDGDSVTVDYGGVSTLVFALSTGATAAPVPAATAEIPASGELQLGSKWYGELVISEHSGSGTLEDGTREVWGVIDDTADGDVYFELYGSPEMDDTPILSFWVELYSDHLSPVIGEEDAWLFNVWLDERDVAAFTLYPSDGALSAEYFYNDGSEQCTVSFSLRPES